MGRSRIDPASHEYLHEPERGKSACPTFAGVSPCESHGDFVEAWIENVAAMPGTVHHGAMGLRYVLLHRWSDVVDFLGIWAWDYPRCARSLLFEIPHRTDCLEVGGFYMSHIDDAVSHQRLREGLCGGLCVAESQWTRSGLFSFAVDEFQHCGPGINQRFVPCRCGQWHKHLW